jgi:hypothetical protein
MAEMVPDRLPANASRGEKEVFGILQDLPDDCIVYYEPIISARYPDFVVIGPTLGILIIEVKGWQPKHLQGASSQQIVVLEGGQPVQRPHPLRQARDYMYGLMDYCRQQLTFNTLVHPEGDYQNRFIFPFGFMAVLSNITQDQLQNHTLGDLTTLFPYPKVIPRDVLLEQWRPLRPDDLPQALCKAFDPWWSFPPLSEPQINALRAIIHPEVQLTLHLTPVAKPAIPTAPAPTVLQILESAGSASGTPRAGVRRRPPDRVWRGGLGQNRFADRPRPAVGRPRRGSAGSAAVLQRVAGGLFAGLLGRLPQCHGVSFRWLVQAEWDHAAHGRRQRPPGRTVAGASHAAKGLQYRVVILLWADQLPGSFANSDEAADHCLMYVALTRPEDLLFITASRPSPFVQRIQDSGKVEVRPLCQ